MDNRGSWGRGHAFESPILKRLGELELTDQLEGIAQLKKLPFVDGSRIGICGWSYGGYMTLYAATHAPEIVQGRRRRRARDALEVLRLDLHRALHEAPGRREADAYEKPRPRSRRQRGSAPKLLILHGTSDDNVHMQQTVAFADALMRAGKDYTFVPLPRQKHGPRDPAARLYANKRILEFFEKNL